MTQQELAEKARPLTDAIGRGTRDEAEPEPLPLVSELVLDQEIRDRMGW